jgi:adenylosuccinate lyase
VIKGLVVHKERMLANMELTKGLVFSQKTMLLLVEKGLSRESAYEIVQENSMKTWDESGDFRSLISSDQRVVDLVTASELESLFDYEKYTEFVDDIYKKAGL